MISADYFQIIFTRRLNRIIIFGLARDDLVLVFVDAEKVRMEIIFEVFWFWSGFCARNNFRDSSYITLLNIFDPGHHQDGLGL